MYDVIVDIDGVLLDIHTGLKQHFANLGLNYDVNDVYTYDFNKDLPDDEKYNKLPKRDAIYEAFFDPKLYQNSPVDWDSISLIRRYSRQGLKYLIYTLSSDMSVSLTKQTMFLQWFHHFPNVEFASEIDKKMSFKKGRHTRTVIEDSHINLRNYSPYVHKFLVNKPYNTEAYNMDYSDVFKDPYFTRCSTTLQAVELASSIAIASKIKDV